MYELCDGKPKSLQYEDIVVTAFKHYPQDFQLRGHPEYPDSSDIHKPLYKMKKDGLVRSANKRFQLTERGVEVARQLSHSEKANEERLTKSEVSEIDRILKCAAFRLFQEGRSAQILDTDFYDYLGATVRTGNSDFLGRLENVSSALKAHALKQHNEISAALQSLHGFLINKFQDEIEARA